MTELVDSVRFIGMDDDPRELTAEIAGSKAAQLWRMARLGLDVPPAFVMPISLCAAVNRGEENALADLDKGLRFGVQRLERATRRRFGDQRTPLLVSVRSGAARSMPGMLETGLNIGLNDQTVHGFIGMTGDPRLAWDSFRRLIQGYAEVVAEAGRDRFASLVERMCVSECAASEAELDSEALERLTQQFRDLAANAGAVVPDDPYAQLTEAARAVYRSWNSARAREYRRLNRLDDLAGTAVTVQAMVFGNAGATSGAGVAFSRNPATGADELYVDFLCDAQGEDIVSGRRTPGDAAELAARHPTLYRELANSVKKLEREFGDMQDVEFAIEKGKLYFLQTRPAKRTPIAALKVAIDLAREGLIDRETALARASRIPVESLGMARFQAKAAPIASAIPASLGVASGRVAFDSSKAKEIADRGDPVILVRKDTSTEDVVGFSVAAGILTSAGGPTSHAAVVAREMGRVCLVGCRELLIDLDYRKGRIGENTINEGDWISLDGNAGEVMLGQLPVVVERPKAELAEIELWQSQLGRADADRR